MKKFQNKINKLEWFRIKNFLKNDLRNDHPLLKKKFFFWQYKVEENIKINIINLTKKKKIISFNGYIKLKTLIKKKIYNNIYWTTNWYADKKFIGSGVAVLNQTIKFLKNICTVGVVPSAEIFYEKKKFKKINKIRRNFIVLNKERCREFLLDKKFLQLIKFHTLDKNIILKNKIKLKLKLFNYKTYKPNWKNYKNIDFMAIRDSNFIKWRYMSHPYFNYKILSYGSSNKPTLLVYRIEKYKNNQNKIGKICRLVDFFHADENKDKEIANELLLNFFKKMIKEKVIFVDFFCNHYNFSKIFNNFKQNKDIDYKNIFATRFQPIKIENFKINFYYKIDSTKYNISKKSYISKSDIDGDVIVRV